MSFKLKNFSFEFYETLVEYFKMKDIDSKMGPVMSPAASPQGSSKWDEIISEGVVLYL